MRSRSPMRDSNWFIALAEDAEWAAKQANSAIEHEQFLRFAEHWRRLAGGVEPETSSDPRRQGGFPR
jgi:hypothetical protein